MLSRAKTVALGLLVLLSIVLSFELWHGPWSTPSVAPFTGPLGLRPVANPNLKQVTRPVRVVYQTGNPLKYSVGLPGTASYETVLTWLQKASVSKQNSISTYQAGEGTGVDVRFGTPLSRSLLLAYVPNAPTLPAGATVSGLWLTVPPRSNQVFLTVLTNNGETSAVTDLSVQSFEAGVSSAVRTEPWQQVGEDSYLPVASFPVERQIWSTSSPQVLPLVRSFFVNPQVITRVSGPNQTVIWTDGSRAVQWNETSNTLQFSDPNATTSNTASSSLRTIVSYLQTHGGTQGQSIALKNATTSPVLLAHTYSFRPYIGGLELLGTLGNYTVDWLDGSPVGYERPLTELGTLQSTTAEKTLSAAATMDIIDAMVPKALLPSIKVSLACEAQLQSANTVLIEPVVDITHAGQDVLRIDAVTGQVLSGGSAS
ncbi:hypothetical protein [Alicyclobacillus sp. ALC3]|uniref:hypothetical protein n=1 Tax=Alicyclobacillus sp. ALC3 TaxID=2796143 RepID=UPI002378C8DF|nr:hypothetical protein [Alicyclobacillus sp. ALC3]WDL99174.1 hypothetical protein JC200_11330 [Alicyclobacillus sp. ALC3]